MFIRNKNCQKLMGIIEGYEKQVVELSALYEESRKREKLLEQCYLQLFDFVKKTGFEFPEEVQQKVETIKRLSNKMEP